MVQAHIATTGTRPTASGPVRWDRNGLRPGRPGLATETIAFTPAGRATLEQELRRLRDERLPALAALIAEAREDTAVRKENADLVLIQLEQQRAERRAAELEWLLAVAHEIAPPPDGVIALGSHVEVADAGERDVYQLVDPREADVAEGRVSIASPVGQALLGHMVGDDVVVEAPAGERRLRVVAVSWATAAPL